MYRGKELISSVFIVAVAVVICMLLRQGVIDMTALGYAIAAILVAAIAGALWWGWGERIEHRFNRSTNEKLEKELTLLINPLYAKLNKNDEIIDFMTMYKISRIHIYRDSQRPNGDAQREELEKLEEEIKEIMLQYGPLASDQLYNLIKKFKDLGPDWRQDNSFEAKKVLWEIKRITGERQDELRTMLRKIE